MTIISGALVAWAASAPEPRPVMAQEATLQRNMIFKVLAPKGYEDAGYVAMECKPNMYKTRLLNGRK
jgi:hypothetical protein